METKIIKAVFGGGTSTVTNKRTRTDYGQVLEIIGIDLPDTFECIFSNSNTSAGVGKKMIGSSQRVLIPDEYLATGQTIYAWILLHDSEDDGRHMYSVRIPVADMPDTSPEEPTPVEQSVISQAITALNSAVDTTSQKAQEATESADRAEQAAEGVEGYAERAESAQQAAESARDRAIQAETSARTSAATASEKASEAISSATTASQSALTAESASESAQEYASASAVSASQASGYASTAESKATEASGYASNANTSAQTASQKASEATQSASTAVQAKTDAETAKTASETAQGLAEQARNEAVSAKTGAESARDEAQTLVDSITGKVEQIDSNTDRIESLEDDRYKPYPTDSVSGSITSFPDGADGIPLKSCIVRVEPVQSGSGDPSPDNIRPISGWTGCEVQRTGKNLFYLDVDKTDTLNGVTGTFDAKTQTISIVGTNTHSSAYVLLRLECTGDIPREVALARALFNVPSGVYTNLVYKKNGVWFSVNNGGPVPSEIDTPVILQIGIYGTATTINATDIKGQIGLGSTVTDYEPYSGQTYDITFPTEAGTIYGGYVDVTGGELVVDRAMVDLGTLTWIYNATYAFFFSNSLTDRKIGVTNMVSDLFKTEGGSWSGVPKANALWGNGSNETIYVQYPITEVSEFLSLISGHQLVYELATPITYHLTPKEITSLLGQNNIWADTGDCEVEYRADTKLYITKKITEAVSALL